MTNLRRSDFVSGLANKALDVGTAKKDAAFQGVKVESADLDGDGKIATAAEAEKLFKLIDAFDHNGDAASVLRDNADGSLTRSGTMAERALALAVPVAPQIKDAALSKAFGTADPALQKGAKGEKVVALQYALARLDALNSLVDGSFGPKTKAALEGFQRGAGLPVTGTLDARTLAAIDSRLSGVDLRTPAARSADPLAYLSDFNARGLSKVQIQDRSKPVTWNSPEVRTAYSKFVGEYWNVLKENRLECDCKTLGLFFMDQFRAKVKADTGVQLPLPSSGQDSVPQADWKVSTAEHPNGYFSRFEDLPKVRPGYDAAQAIQRLDPKQSMIQGVNVRYPNVDANMVSRAATTVAGWDPARDNAGDPTRPEIPVEKLQPGDLVLIDHTGDKRFDHVVNVIGVERDAAGQVKRLVLGTGSYDDMKDADGATAPNGTEEVNNYTEEVTVDLDSQGKVASSKVTWSSEPGWLVSDRYSARTTLMEMKPGGTLKIGRWL
ncbi:MAG TPA: peptidoglycan-binding domain-containing protein [Myxococcales bacterium]